jgi:hypothetical protein
VGGICYLFQLDPQGGLVVKFGDQKLKQGKNDDISTLLNRQINSEFTIVGVVVDDNVCQ